MIWSRREPVTIRIPTPLELLSEYPLTAMVGLAASTFALVVWLVPSPEPITHLPPPVVENVHAPSVDVIWKDSGKGLYMLHVNQTSCVLAYQDGGLMPVRCPWEAR